MTDREPRRLGSVTEARDALGLPDGAAVWELIAAKILIARQGEFEGDPMKWTVYDPR